jgi:parallel beta-helix repeat protein
MRKKGRANHTKEATASWPQFAILVSRLIIALAVSAVPLVLMAAEIDKPDEGRLFYIRQSVGDDTNDGRSPQTAWRSLSNLGEKLQSGDTAFVGPGLYREMLTLTNSGVQERPITLIGDTTGEHTTDQPGVVMITGADPVDETIFTPEPARGVYRAMGLEKLIMNVVEMDGPQYRYPKAFDTTEHIRGGMPEREVVNRKPSSMFYDRDTKTLYIHTSDNQSPTTHEIELIRRNYGIVTYGKEYIIVIGFTFRHMGTAGLNFQKGSHHCTAINNKSYGSWQGIRVFGSNDVLVANNELFRNSNSGIYFALGSARGRAIGNRLYENAKGVRWGSQSVDGLALGNVAFGNRETGISIEDSDGVRVLRNTLAANLISQLAARKSRYISESNCFAPSGEDTLTATLGPFEHYRSLADYRHATNHDLTSRKGCGELPGMIDVHSLHAETQSWRRTTPKN